MSSHPYLPVLLRLSGGGDGHIRGAATTLARQADACQTNIARENDATGHVVPGIALVLLHDRELHAIDEQQLIEGEPQSLGNQYVDFNQRHAAGVVSAQGAVARPVAGETLPEVLRQSRVLGLTPGLVGKTKVVDLIPQRSKVGCEAIKSEIAAGEFRGQIYAWQL